MLRLITFLEEASGVELVLPVTPSSYQWPHEAAIETVTVDQLGDLNFFGGKRMGSTTLHDCLLPAQAYPFLSPGAGTNPWVYLEQLERWVDRGTVVRWLVSGTPVNAAVLLEGVTYREQDGTNDLYADITLRQYTRPETPVLPAEPSASGAGTAASRDSATGTATAKPASAQIAEATVVKREETAAGTARFVPWVPESAVKSLADLELDKIASGGGLWQSTRW